MAAPTGSIHGLAFEGGGVEGPCLEVESGAMEITGNRLGPWAGNGFLVRDGAAPLIRENQFVDIEGSAVVFEEGGGGVAEMNRIERTTQSAIRVRAGADPTVRGNEIAEAGQAGLLIEQGAEGQYTENRILASGASGTEARGGAAPQVAGNQIEESGQAGIFIHEGARGDYQDNVILGSKLSGIVVTGGAAPLVTGNEIADGDQHGLLILGGASGRFAENVIRGNKGGLPDMEFYMSDRGEPTGSPQPLGSGLSAARHVPPGPLVPLLQPQPAGASSPWWKCSASRAKRSAPVAV